MTEMTGQHYRLNGHEFEQTPGYDEGWGSLACCSPWGVKEQDTTQQLNNYVEKKKTFKIIMLDQKTEGEKIDKFYLKTIIEKIRALLPRIMKPVRKYSSFR